jgi:cold shock CspA family protein
MQNHLIVLPGAKVENGLNRVAALRQRVHQERALDLLHRLCDNDNGDGAVVMAEPHARFRTSSCCAATPSSRTIWRRTQPTSERLFVHFPAIQMPGYRTLAKGAEVEYSVKIGRKGLKAVDVTSCL